MIDRPDLNPPPRLFSSVLNIKYILNLYQTFKLQTVLCCGLSFQGLLVYLFVALDCQVANILCSQNEPVIVFKVFYSAVMPGFRLRLKGGKEKRERRGTFIIHIQWLLMGDNHDYWHWHTYYAAFHGGTRL